jgi:hypothetical protein
MCGMLCEVRLIASQTFGSVNHWRGALQGRWSSQSYLLSCSLHSRVTRHASVGNASRKHKSGRDVNPVALSFSLLARMKPISGTPRSQDTMMEQRLRFGSRRRASQARFCFSKQGKAHVKEGCEARSFRLLYCWSQQNSLCNSRIALVTSYGSKVALLLIAKKSKAHFVKAPAHVTEAHKPCSSRTKNPFAIPASLR